VTHLPPELDAPFAALTATTPIELNYAQHPRRDEMSAARRDLPTGNRCREAHLPDPAGWRLVGDHPEAFKDSRFTHEWQTRAAASYFAYFRTPQEAAEQMKRDWCTKLKGNFIQFTNYRINVARFAAV
jgi:hypothetical protein